MRKRTLGQVTRVGVVYLFVAWCMAPVAWLISTSLKSDVQAFSPTPVWVFTPHFGNYANAWNDGGMGHAMIVSTIIALASSVLGIAAGLPLAYLITQVWEPGSYSSGRVALGILLLTTLPPVLGLTPLYRAFFPAGLTNNYGGLIIVHSFYATLLALLIFRSFLTSFPREIREAASIDGLGEWRTLAYCVMPNVWGGMFATLVLALIQSWNEYLYALVLLPADLQSVPVTVSSFLSFFGTNWGRLTSAGVIGALPIVIFAIIVRKHLARGLTFGGVK